MLGNVIYKTLYKVGAVHLLFQIFPGFQVFYEGPRMFCSRQFKCLVFSCLARYCVVGTGCI